MASKSTFSWDVDTWESLDCYFNQNKVLTQHQLDSYNNLVDYLIPQIIERNNPVTIATDHDGKEFRKSLVIEFGQTYLSKPLIHENTDVIKSLYPNEARLRGLTYAAPMFIDVKYTITKSDGGKPVTQTETINKIPFLKLPVMLHSKYCHLSDHNESSLPELGECEYDQGGYFIVNGSEKVIVSQERVAENQVFVFTPPKTITGKFTHIAEIKTAIDQRFYPIKTNLVKLSKEPTARSRNQSRNQAAEKGYVSGRCLYVRMPLIKEDIPLFIMFRALGILQEKEMFEMILPDLDTIGSNYTNFLIPSVGEARVATAGGGKIIGITTQEAALKYLAERLNITFSQSFKDQHADCQIKYVKDVLTRELFPHIGQIGQQIGQTFRKKAFFLGYMTRKLIDCYFGVRPFDDRDHYGNKRVDLAGHLLNKLFRAHFIKLIRDLRGKLLPLMTDTAKIPQQIRDLIRGCNIDSKIKYGLATGNWNTQKSSLSSSNKGIAQVLNRLSFAGALSHTRRIQSPLERAGSKIVPPRRLHGTHYGMCCPNETPEGQQIGIVKNLAMQTHVTIQTSDYPMRIILNKLGVIDLIETVAKDINCCTKIFINGEWFGVIKENITSTLYNRLKILKRHGVIVPYISIAWFIEWKEIHIQTDGGRYSRPLYIVENDELLIGQLFDDNPEFREKLRSKAIKWPHLLMGLKIDAKTAQLDNGGVIEYLDTNEIETSMIAMTHYDMTLNAQAKEQDSHYVKYTHCEIHPMMMMGVVASMIPFSDHNQSPRNCYQSSMAKQSIGYYVTNYNSRMDTLAHVLVYGHKPLVSTRTAKYVIMDKLPHGVTSMLLYACYTGYNQEDSIIVNGDAVERGFFNTIFFRTYLDKAVKNRSVTTATERFTKPEPDKNPTRDAKIGGTYDAIDRDGVPILGKKVRPGDVIIGKVIEMKETKEKDHEFIYKDVSTPIKQNEHGEVDKVIPDPEGKILPYNAEGNRIVKARVSVLRKPEIGDKFASRYSQKGTTGILYKSYDMPFTCGGLVPDMIMNPHGIPSRMTVGKLLETLLGRVAVCTGKMQDATPFVSYNFESFKQTLKTFGMDELGNEVMYNGQTGRMFDVTFFYGPTYYQRLKHMVDDKVHCLKADHEVLTTAGWKSITHVTLEDQVATIKNGLLVYDKPIKILQFPDYSGKMYHIKNQQIDLDVTLNHRMWVSAPYGRKKEWLPYQLVQAENIVGKHVKYQKNAQWNQPDYQFILPAIDQESEKIFDMDAWLTFFGIWIAEGWTTTSTRVQICQCKERVMNVIFDAIEKLGYSRSNSNDDKITICDKQLHSYLSTYSVYDPNKYLPSWVWELSQQQCQKLIYNMQLGDGTFKHEGGSCYYTSSVKLADEFMRLCLHAGWSSNKTKHLEAGHSTLHEGRQITAQYDMWRLSVIKSKNYPAVNHGHHKEQNIQIEEVYDYTGPVYCLQVPSEVFYVRRNGLPVWTGNSRESGPVQLLTRQPAEGRSRDGGLRLGEMERDVFIAHGIPKFLKERMMDSSDLFKVYVSKKEEAIIVGNAETNVFKYNGQPIKDDEIMQIQLPYAMKLLLQELESMGIDIRLKVN